MQSMENMHRSVGAVKLEQVVVSWTHCAPLHFRRFFTNGGTAHKYQKKLL